MHKTIKYTFLCLLKSAKLSRPVTRDTLIFFIWPNFWFLTLISKINTTYESFTESWLKFCIVKLYLSLQVIKVVSAAVRFLGHWLDMVYLPPRGNFVDYIFLEAQCLARILQHVSPLTMAALSCNSLLHTLPYKIFDN